MSSIANNDINFDARTIVLDMVHDAKAIVDGRNQGYGIRRSLETIASLSKERVLTCEKIKMAFEGTMKLLDADIGHLSEESQRGAILFLQNTQADLIGKFENLKMRQAALKDPTSLRAFRSEKMEFKLLRANESELWHHAIDQFQRGAATQFDPSELDQSDVAKLVDDEFNDPILNRESEREIIQGIEMGIVDSLMGDIVKELNEIFAQKAARNRISDRLSNCEEKGD